MTIYISNTWPIFCLLLAIVIATNLVMTSLNKNFYTNDVLVRRFSIMDLQLPASPVELVNLIKGMFALPAEVSAKALRSLKRHLLIDFIFMIAGYGCIFLLCMHVSAKMSEIGQNGFAILGWALILALIFDVIENVLLLGMLTPKPRLLSHGEARGYLWLVIFKWAIALTGLICSLSALLYFWLTGQYSAESLPYLLIVTVEVILFLALKIIFVKKSTLMEKKNPPVVPVG